MKTLVASIIGLAIATFANPAMAYLLEITTSIPVTSAADDGQFKNAVKSAIDDVLKHAIGFVPTVVTLQDARVVGERLYILLLIADDEGEQTIKTLSREEPGPTGSAGERK